MEKIERKTYLPPPVTRHYSNGRLFGKESEILIIKVGGNLHLITESIPITLNSPLKYFS